MKADEIRAKQSQLRKQYKDKTYESFKVELDNALQRNPLIDCVRVDELSYFAQDKLKDEGFKVKHYSPSQREYFDGVKSHYIVSW